MDLAKESRTLTESPPKAPRRFQTYFPLFLSAAVLLLSVFLAGQHHFSLPRPSPPESPPDAFSEGRARLLLQAANRSVRTVGSCDNEVSAPLLLHAAVLHQILMLSPSPSTATSGAASGLATGVGSEMQAAIARLRYVVLVTHHLRREAATDASPTPAAGAAADADEDDPAKPHRAQQQDLPPPCMTHALQAKCAAVLSRSGVHDFFSPSGGAAAAAAFAIGRATEAPAEELPCLDSPRLVDPDLPDFLPGTLIPKFQCISVTRHILAPPSTVSALIGLFLRERQQKAEEQQHEGTGRSFEAALDEAALIGSHQLLMYLEDISKSERDSHVAAAAAAATTAAAAGVPVLEYLSKNHLLSADVSLWGGAAGGFTLTYAGSSRTALYEGPKNITVDFRPVGSRQSMHANSQGTKQTSGQALMLAAHYDSAPSSPGISDDLGMCAVALEVARAAVYRHLRAAHALQLRHWGFSHHAEEGLEDALLQSPLILNLNGAEEVILLAAHAFATQHPLARQVSLAVNLEAAGSRGKSFVLQMPPRLSAETLQAVGNLPAPHVCCIAADVWNSGQFPGETDFRIWSEVLQVPGGLDLAWIGGGASYHTTRDTLESMQPGSLQHTGEMILALLHPLLRIAAKARSGLAAASDARHQAAPRVPFYQDVLGRQLLAYLALLDGLSGPAGRSGESLLFADVLLILGVLLPVWLLLPAVLCPPLFHASHAEARRRNSDPSSARLAQGLQREMRVTRKLWMLAAAVAAAGVSFAVSVFLLEAPAVPLPLHFGRTESSPSVPPYSGEVSIGIQDPHGTASALPPQQRLLQPFSLFGARARSLLGLLPESLQRLLLPSPSFPFSPERPLQLHFVAFRQSKVTAVALLQQSSSPPGTAAQVVKDSSTLSTGTAEESPVVEPTTEASQSQFPPEVQPLTTTNHTEKLVRSSTQGVAVLGLGPQVFWNPAAADTDLVLSAIRAAVEAAEATAAQPASAGDADKGFRPAHAASSQHESDTASRGDVCTSQSSILPNAEQTNALSLAAEAASAAAARASSCAPPAAAEERARQPPLQKKKSLPAFYVKEEPPRQDAPLALPHLFRMSTHRTHWSVYTNAQEFLPPPAPLGNEGAPHVYSPGIRGQVAIHYNDAQDETRLTLLIGGSSLLTLALPADKVVRWNLQNQAPLQKLKKCECYVVTITSPFPPVQTKLEFFFKGNEPMLPVVELVYVCVIWLHVRFTTRSAVFDAVTPNTGCLQTPLFRSVHSYLLGLPMIEQPRLPAKSDLSTAAAAAEARTDSAPMGASSGSGVFWKTLLATSFMDEAELCPN
ncbi:hypothetical protein cyc_01301 [Cyclospora cayetanensis]|uniref:Peptidase M28 domain-containing protein n=1 Tax=Cyclospora cayetanensis TaxID=88456 RepID=A0A1D3D9B5_9EIME|nr:hypothetical protein cyc_01301 [Cyclospora cayetanensis]